MQTDRGRELEMTLQQLRYAIAVADNGSMNEAAKKLFISQPSLSGMIKDLEEELDIQIFLRSNRGILITPEGMEFLGYARQVMEQYRLMENRFIEKKVKKKFSVSTQHYTFAVKAFVELVKRVGMEEYEFAVYETKTYEILEAVRSFKSELGILYLNDFNQKAMNKLFHENSLEFVELFSCHTCVYLWTGHPLADKKVISMKELEEYPCLSFDQGNNNSFYLAEEVLSTYDYKKIIKASDRATLLNLMVGLNGYTLCSGIICEELNGYDYKVVPLKEEDRMHIGYVKRKGSNLSEMAEIYVEELRKCKVSLL